MMAGIIPGLFGLVLAYFLAKRLKHRGSKVEAHELVVGKHDAALPAFGAAIAAPLVAIILLALRPIAGIAIDPLVALPVGLNWCGGYGAMKHTNQYMVSGLSRMAPVAIMLLGTGTLAGIIANSGLKDVLITGLTASGMPSYLLAPISGP